MLVWPPTSHPGTCSPWLKTGTEIREHIVINFLPVVRNGSSSQKANRLTEKQCLVLEANTAYKQFHTTH